MKKMRVLTILICLSVTAPFTIADTWLQMQKIYASDGAGYDYFGRAAGISGHWAIAGAHISDGSGSACIYSWDGGAWTQQAKLLPNDSTGNDFFGWAVAIDGDFAIVGSRLDNDLGDSSGSAYIFKRDGQAWTQQCKLLASDGAAHDNFGASVAICGDWAIVSAFVDDDRGTDSGSIYLFQYDGAAWTQKQKLVASDGSAGDYFGASVSIRGDAAIAGAYLDDSRGTDSGSAYIFRYNGTAWIQQKKLTASDGAANDHFGGSVSISGDAAIVAAPADDDMGNNSGSAYVFHYNGTAWMQTQKLTACDGRDGDNFGISVSVDGNAAIAGAWGSNVYGVYSGSAYLFKCSGQTWTLQSKLIASDGTVTDYFGHSVGISGNAAIVGAYGDDDLGTQAGAAYVFGFSPDEDLNGDCKVNLVDLVALSAHWQQTGCPTGCENADIDVSGSVDLPDLLSIIGAWLYGI